MISYPKGERTFPPRPGTQSVVILDISDKAHPKPLFVGRYDPPATVGFTHRDAALLPAAPRRQRRERVRPLPRRPQAHLGVGPPGRTTPGFAGPRPLSRPRRRSLPP